MEQEIVIYTDGSAKGNGSKTAKGGFGVVVCDAYHCGEEKDYTPLLAYQEQEDGTTNNRMEMKAILWALEKFGNPGSHTVRNPETNDELMTTSLTPIVFSDSAYAVNTFTNWIHGWKRNSWVRAKGQPIENLDLVKKWDSLTSDYGYKIDLRHVRGHVGNKWNELADALATGRVEAEDLNHQFLQQRILKSEGEVVNG